MAAGSAEVIDLIDYNRIPKVSIDGKLSTISIEGGRGSWLFTESVANVMQKLAISPLELWACVCI